MPLSVRQHAALVLVAAAALVAAAGVARAQDTTRGVRIGLTYTPGTKPGVLVLPVNGSHGDSVRTILQRDLDFGDRVNVIAIDASSLDSTADGSRGQFNYPLYARLGAAAMVQATVTETGVHVAIHDVAKQRVERVRDHPISEEPLSADWRMALHEVSDELEFLISGVRGIAATRILYSSAGRVWQVDSDGAGATALTGDVGALFPSWHPKGTHITYTTLGNLGSTVVLREIGGPTRTIAGTPGTTNITPVFSPDGSILVYSTIRDMTADLVAVSPFNPSEPMRRVTVGRNSLNTKPSFSADGRRIAYTSDRLGHPEVYISDADGTNAELLTPFNYGDQSHRSDPDWSPDGRLIAFQSQIEGRFQIMTINPRDRVPRRHTSEGINEFPSWAPDSRHLVFMSTRSGSKQLWVLDVESGRVRQLTRVAAGARYGDWSPLLRGR